MGDGTVFVTKSASGYDSSGDWVVRRADYLILANDFTRNDNGSISGIGHLYACVRRVAMSQCGHFMMGNARIAGNIITLSGPYGSDGLPLDWDDIPENARAHFTIVPDDIAEAYWKPASPGHNGTGSEAPTMLEFSKTLPRPKRRAR